MRQVVAPGWFFLAAMILAYGVANLLQSMAAARTSVHHTFDPGLLVRLAGQRTYLLGIACQTHHRHTILCSKIIGKLSEQ